MREQTPVSNCLTAFLFISAFTNILLDLRDKLQYGKLQSNRSCSIINYATRTIKASITMVTLLHDIDIQGSSRNAFCVYMLWLYFQILMLSVCLEPCKSTQFNIFHLDYSIQNSLIADFSYFTTSATARSVSVQYLQLSVCLLLDCREFSQPLLDWSLISHSSVSLYSDIKILSQSLCNL